MLKIKYKAHKLINLIFYLFIFLLGFICGGGKIENIKEVINSILY